MLYLECLDYNHRHLQVNINFIFYINELLCALSVCLHIFNRACVSVWRLIEWVTWPIVLKTVEPIRVCVLGHSFIRRLNVFNGCGKWKLEVKTGELQCGFRATGGLTIKKSVKDEQFMTFTNSPDIVFIQMGENDLDNGVSVEKLSRDIISYANFLIEGWDFQLCVTIDYV